MSKLKSYVFFKTLLRIPVPWIYVLTYLIGLGFHFIFPFKFLHSPFIIYIKIVGVLLFLTGAVFAAWSLIIFHRARTTTTPGEHSKKLVNTGPYRISRNPMYISLFFAYIGEAGLLAQLWPILVLPLLFAYLNWIVIPLEEDILKNDYKEDYQNYCKKVNRWI